MDELRLAAMDTTLHRAMSPVRSVTVFGGTGFLGRRIVDALLARDVTVRVAAAVPRYDPGTVGDGLVPVQADLADPYSVRAALEGADAAVNSVRSMSRAETQPTKRSMSRAPATGAGCRRRRARRLVHISGIGSDARSTSAYIRARAATARTRCARSFLERRSCGRA